MRIAYIVSSLRIGGAERHVVQLVGAMRSLGQDLLVATLTSKPGDLESEVEALGVCPVRAPLGSLRSPAALARLRSLERVVREFGPDLIHAHLYHAEITGALLARRLHVPLIVTRHHEAYFGPRWKVRVLRTLLPGDHAVIAVGRPAALEAEAFGTAPERIRVLPNSYDETRFGPACDAEERRRLRAGIAGELGVAGEEGEPWFGSVGNLRPGKGFHLFAEAAARYLTRRGPARFFLVGDGPERRRLESLAGGRGLQGRFHLVGQRKDVPRWLQAWDFYVNSSSTEGLSLALLEAAATGLPLIATRIPGNEELLTEGASIPVSNVNAMCLAEAFEEAVRLREDGRLPGPDPASIRRAYGSTPWGRAHLETYENLLHL